MSTKKIAALVLAVATSALACGGASDSAPADGTSEDALGTYDRQTVYAEVKGNAHAPGDLLKSTITDAKLVDALGWLLDQNPPPFYISAIRTDHHNDGVKAHAGGHALDMYAKDSGDAKKLVQLLDADPYVVEIGLGGAYKSYRHSITSKMYFDDNNATHMHLGVVHAFGH